MRSSDFEAIPSKKFDYYLAQQLHMTVAHLRATMSSMEWREWHTYFRLQQQEEELETLKAKARAGRK